MRPSSRSQRLEGAQPARDDEIDGHDEDGDGGEGGGERDVGVDADVTLDHVADELVLAAADQERRDEITEGEGEREDRAGDDPV